MKEIVVSIHQPNYLPYLGFFDKIKKSDIFVIFDDVQFVRTGKFAWQHRNRIRTKEGWMWLTIPVKREITKINQVEIADEIWKVKHWKSIKTNYNSSKHWFDYSDFLEGFYSKNYKLLVDVTIPLIKWLMDQLNVKTKMLIASDMGIDSSLHATDHLIEIIKKVGGNVYLSGILGKEYLEENKFQENDIKLVYQDFLHPTYEQNFLRFVPNLSAIDFLFCKD